MFLPPCRFAGFLHSSFQKKVCISVWWAVQVTNYHVIAKALDDSSGVRCTVWIAMPLPPPLRWARGDPQWGASCRPLGRGAPSAVREE